MAKAIERQRDWATAEAAVAREIAGKFWEKASGQMEAKKTKRFHYCGIWRSVHILVKIWRSE